MTPARAPSSEGGGGKGDRSGQVVDPFGQKWTLATRKIEMTPAQMKAAADAFIASMKK